MKEQVELKKLQLSSNFGSKGVIEVSTFKVCCLNKRLCDATLRDVMVLCWSRSFFLEKEISIAKRTHDIGTMNVLLI